MEEKRRIEFYKDYFSDFYAELSYNVRKKIQFVFKIIRKESSIPQKFLKHIEDTDGLYEIRVTLGSNIYRIFCCFDKGNLVVLFNAYQKKTQKTNPQEIKLALKLKNEYFKTKKNGKISE
ncbi:MAG: type II toxin-antitoxin system RelE/ParE family toxin [Tannerella sp.]|nr:type II toxin-antitoxin system RelE/ParE family toxin [Tannerella sp.]